MSRIKVIRTQQLMIIEIESEECGARRRTMEIFQV
jgi:hypothetical protein